MSRAIRILLVVAALGCCTRARAHPAQIACGLVHIDHDGRFHLSMTFDTLAFALNDTPQRVSDVQMNALLDGPSDALAAALEDAKDRLGHSLRVQTDRGQAHISAVAFPTVRQVNDWKNSGALPRLPVMLDASIDGHLPAGAHAVAFKFPEALGAFVLTVERPDTEARAFAIEAGEISDQLPISLDASASLSQRADPAPPPVEPGRVHVAVRYLRLGFEHIVPNGLDHILFVLGLFLLGSQLRPLLWQVSAFTVAHSITLALSLYGVIRLPPGIVEPLIAASIAFIAVENLYTDKLKPWRPAVVFGFGLVHGLGFAGVLMSMGLPRHDFLPALLSFNAGVELGQLAVIALALLAVGSFRRRAWYRPAVAIPASLMIAAVGIFWTIQRII
jgi:hypothetical protein